MKQHWETYVFAVPDLVDMPFQVVGMGLNAVDRLLHVDRYPDRGGKEEILTERILPGGQVATAMITCRRLGLERVRYIGKVGDDGYGRIARDSLLVSGVDCRCLVTEPGTANQAATIVVDGQSGERTIFWSRPDSLNFRPGELTEDAICCAPVLHLDGHDQDAALWCARRAREKGMVTVLDIDKVRDKSTTLLACTDFCIMSENFPRVLSGEAELHRALRAMRRFCPGFLAVTVGPQGVCFLWGDEFVRVPGYTIRAVDSTGAGDVFHGAFIYAYLQGWPVGRTLRFANAAAALSCTEPGARGGLRTAAEVLAFMESTATNPLD
ncbi:MAG: ribokinase [Acidobacteria bacterium]|nr:ribokinase [Acidobacteriota bacterium]